VPEPRVSVVLTTYNQERYVREAVDSVLRQTLPIHELIICDDFSSDGTRTIIEEYCEVHPAVVRPVFQSRNVGVAANRQAGLDAATGEFVTLLSGDDYLHDAKVEREVEALRSTPTAGWAYSGVCSVDEAGEPIREFVNPGSPEGDLFEAIVLRRVSPRYMMMRASAMRACGPFDSSLRLYEDWDFKIRLSHRFEAVHVPELLSVYRVHAEGLHRTTRSVHVRDMESVVERALALAADRPPEVRRRLRQRTDDILLTHWVRYGYLEGERKMAWERLAPRLRGHPLRPAYWRMLAALVAPGWLHTLVRRLRRAVKRRLVAVRHRG
jgi:glycosyltransferase involved in cell wall biosynthesis